MPAARTLTGVPLSRLMTPAECRDANRLSLPRAPRLAPFAINDAGRVAERH